MPIMLRAALFASPIQKRFHLSIDYCAKASMPRTAMRLMVAALALWVFGLLCAAPCFAQASGTIHYPENGIDSRMRSDVQVDPLTHALQFQIPLGSYPGRGGASIPITLSYSSKVWLLKHLSTVGGGQSCTYYPPNCITLAYDTVYGAQYAVDSASGWTSSLDWFKWPEGGPPLHLYTDRGEAASNKGTRMVARMFVRLPDGSKHELRRDDTIYPAGSYLPGTYYAVDGSRLRYETASMTLFMPDGSRYIGTSDYSTMSYVDRNGNTSVYNYSTGQWTDTLGRVINLPPLAAAVGDSVYPLPGMNGSYTLRRANLGDVLTPDRNTGQTPALLSVGDRTSHNTCGTVPSLFVSPDAYCGGDDDHRLMATSAFNPVVLSQIVLPNNQAYTFTYNVYGEIDKLVYPTGGYERFEHTLAPSLSAEYMDAFGDFYAQANRGVDKRWVSAKGDGSDEALWQYTTATSGNDFATEVTAPDGTRTERWLHRGLGSPADFSTGFGPIGFGFEDPRAGRAYDERVYAPNGQMMRRALTEWTVDGTIEQNGFGYRMYKTRNPRVTKEVDIVFDTVGGGNALAKTTTMQYDGDLNVTSATESAYAEVDPSTAATGGLNTQGQITIPAGATLRKSETDYALSGNEAYRARQLIGLPTETRVKDASDTVVARTQMLYDEGGAYQTLSDYGSSVTGWIDPGTNARGLVTTVRRWLDTTGGYLETHAQYDQTGNVRNSWDALGHKSQIIYLSTYAYAYPTSTLSAIPINPGGVQGSNAELTTSTTYDLNTGAVTSTTDANGRTTTYEYAATDSVGNANPLGRLTKVTRPTGGGWTSYEYGRNQYGDYVGVRTVQDASTVLWSYQLFDGLGRPYRSFQNDPTNSSAQWLTVDTQYDALGRAKKVSNPYRSSGWADTDNASRVWTTNGYDALGRVTSVTTPDNAVVSTQYTGNSVLVTDQAGKQRKSYTDAQGRLTQVVEAPNDASFNYATNYTYDVLGNLRKVEQGQQTRFFMYDSLSRLIRAKNPEQAANVGLTGTDSVTNNTQWAMSYSYDSNGSLYQRTDARGVVTTYAYDNLNRNTSINYSDGTGTIVNYYDTGSTYEKGQLWRTCKWASTYQCTDNYHNQMGRVYDHTEWFYGDLGWRNYYVPYSYDLAGHVTSMSYPSGHTVNYSYDSSGRVQGFTGNLGDGVQRSYASNIQYDEASRLKQEQYGSNTPLYHKQHYNVRGQLYDVRLSTVAWANDEWNWNRGAVLNYYDSSFVSRSPNSGADNNGNVLRTEHWIANDDAISGYSFTQERYGYDSLNRVQSVSEFQNGGSQSFVQTYTYDRYGNRTINQGGTTQNAGINSQQFTVDANNNRLGVPTNRPEVMGYDAAGNLTTDTYTAAGTSGAGGRSYDAENRMTQATDAYNNPVASYTYDAEGKRVRRNLSGQETWQIYGAGGELLAEYPASSSVVQQEYGYRAGELLVRASGAAAPVGGGGVAGLQGQYYTGTNFDTLALTRTDASVNFDWGTGAPGAGVGSDTFSVRWTGMVRPRYAETYTFYTQSDDGVRLWVNDQLVIDNWTYHALTENAGQITLQAGQTYSIKMEFFEWGGEAVAKLLWSSASQSKESIPSSQLSSVPPNSIKWLVSDQLGTPRIVADQSGSLAGVSRHDYLPFGEELYANIGGRTSGQGYNGNADGNRKRWAQLERDDETGLDFAEARYYASTQGRFTSSDPLLSSGDTDDPQTWNRYAYSLNNPLKFIDPLGLYVFDKSVSGEERKKFNAGLTQARQNLQKIGQVYGTGSKEYQKAERALNSYGAEGVKNGVTIFANEGAGSGRTQVAGVAGLKTKDNPTGQNIRVAFDPEAFSTNTFGDLVGHEGSHVADGSDWVKSGFANSANPTEYQTEVDGYTVQSLLAQARNPNGSSNILLPGFNEKGKTPYFPENVAIWNSGWAEADRATIRRTNIDKILARPKAAGGLYGLTPASPQKAFQRGSRFR